MHLCEFTLIIMLQRSVNDDFFCCCCWLIITPCSTSIQGTPLFKRHLPWSQGCLLNGARYSTITILRRQKVHCRKTKKYIYSTVKHNKDFKKSHISRSIDRSIFESYGMHTRYYFASLWIFVHQACRTQR